MKCVKLLKSEHLNVPSCIDLAVEFNLLKSTHQIGLQETPPPIGFFSLPKAITS